MVFVDNEIQKIFASNLKKIRLTKKMTQAELAKLIGVSAVAICHYENGRSFPRPAILELIVFELNISLSDLLVEKT